MNMNEQDNEKKETVTPEEEPAPETEASETSEPDAGETEDKNADGKNEKGSRKEIKALKKALEDAEKECGEQKKALEEMTDRYQRMMAEYDNFRKRAQKEKEGIYADAVCDTLGQVLPIKDTLELAVQYADKEKFADGVVMTLNRFGETLEKLGVTAFGEEGETFDPSLHNAVLHAEEEGAPENTIAQVLQMGYRKGDKILRYAMVKVVN